MQQKILSYRFGNHLFTVLIVQKKRSLKTAFFLFNIVMIRLIANYLHFVQQTCASRILVYDVKDVAYIYIDATLFLLFKSDVATKCLPVPVKSTTN